MQSDFRIVILEGELDLNIIIFQVVASDGTTASFMWELQKDPLVKAGPLKAKFSVHYRPLSVEGPSRPFSCCFDIQDYTTLFVIRTKLEPIKGADFCRASQMCCLQLSLQRVSTYMSYLFNQLPSTTRRRAPKRAPTTPVFFFFFNI